MKTKLEQLTTDELSFVRGGSPTLPLPPPAPEYGAGGFKPGTPLISGTPNPQRE